MKLCLACLVLCVLLFGGNAKKFDPKVQLYSHYPSKHGEINTLICHVSNFYPPDIKIELIKNGVELVDAHQTDLSFEDGWKFFMTKSTIFSPQIGDQYECRVTHLGKTSAYVWEVDM